MWKGCTIFNGLECQCYVPLAAGGEEQYQSFACWFFSLRLAFMHRITNEQSKLVDSQATQITPIIICQRQASFKIYSNQATNIAL